MQHSKQVLRGEPALAGAEERSEPRGSRTARGRLSDAACARDLGRKQSGIAVLHLPVEVLAPRTGSAAHWVGGTEVRRMASRVSPLWPGRRECGYGEAAAGVAAIK
jgi:hypothetical protein